MGVQWLGGRVGRRKGERMQRMGVAKRERGREEAVYNVVCLSWQSPETTHASFHSTPHFLLTTRLSLSSSSCSSHLLHLLILLLLLLYSMNFHIYSLLPLSMIVMFFCPYSPFQFFCSCCFFPSQFDSPSLAFLPKTNHPFFSISAITFQFSFSSYFFSLQLSSSI